MQTVKIRYLEGEAVLSVDGKALVLEVPTAAEMESAIEKPPGLFRLKLSPRIQSLPPPSPPPIPAWDWPRPRDGIFAHPFASAGGSGTESNPMSLERALGLGGGGKQIWLRGGIYVLARTITPALIGTQAAPWKISAYPGEQPVLSVNTARMHGLFFTVASAAHQEWRGIRFADLSREAQGGTAYNLIKLNRGNNLSFIHCQIDNCKWSGVISNGPAENILFYGCVVLNNGTNTQNGDHGFYVKSKAGALTIENCLLVNNASHAVHGYNASSSAAEAIRGIRILDNSIFTYGEPSKRFVILDDEGPAKEARDCVVIGNVCFNAFPGKDATDSDRSSIKIVNGANSKVEKNFLWGGEIIASGSVTRLDNFVLKNSVWPAAQVWVRPSRFDPGIAHVTAFNPAAAPSIAADLRGIPAGRYEVRAASAPQKVATTITYSGSGTVSLPMAGLAYDAQIRAGGFYWPGSAKANALILQRVP